MQFDMYHDPGHGWLRVKKSLLVSLGINDKISSYSYQRGDWAYLEEDGDLFRFWTAMLAQGHQVVKRHHIADKRSKIRGYASFKPL